MEVRALTDFCVQEDAQPAGVHGAELGEVKDFRVDDDPLDISAHEPDM